MHLFEHKRKEGEREREREGRIQKVLSYLEAEIRGLKKKRSVNVEGTYTSFIESVLLCVTEEEHA